MGRRRSRKSDGEALLILVAVGFVMALLLAVAQAAAFVTANIEIVVLVAVVASTILGIVWWRRSVAAREIEAAELAAEVAAEEARRSALQAHDSAVATLLARVATGTRVAPPDLAAMLPMKKGEEIFYAIRSRALTARGDEEPGVLIVTNQRVHWNYSNPDRGDVLKTWRGIATWHNEGVSRLVIEWGSGKPLVLLFTVPGVGPEHDARIASEMMRLAQQNAQ